MNLPEGYQIVRVIRRTTAGACAWVRSGPAGEVSVIKSFDPAAGVWGQKRVARRSTRFRARATQHKGLSERYEGWLPVHQIEGDDASAWVRVGAAELSLASLAGSGTGVDAHLLHSVMTQVVDTLARTSEGESAGELVHGNLAPTNVLLSAIATGKPRVWLTDPFHPKELDAMRGSGGGAADRRAIGALICLLATGQRFRRGLWPLVADASWAGLGRQSEAWRDLANELLNPEPSGDLPTFAEIGERIAGLKPVSKALVRSAWGGLGLVASVGLVSLAFMLSRGGADEPVVEFDAVAWADLCDANYTWIGPLRDALSASKRQRWAEDEHLSSRVLSVLSNATLDPRDIIGSQAGLLALRASPPASARTADAAERIREAEDAVESLEAALTPSQWPLLASLDARASELDQRGWSGPASLMRRATEPFSGERDASLYEHIDAALQVASLADRAEASWVEIESSASQIAEAGVPILTRFREAVLVEINPRLSDESAGGFEETASALEDAASLARDIVGFLESDWGSLVDQQKFLDEGTINRSFASGELEGQLNLRTFRSWLLEGGRPEFRAISDSDDPRDLRRWRGELSSIRRAIDILDREFRRDAEEDLPGLRARVEALEAELPDIEATELTVQTVDSIRALSADYESRLGALVEASNGLLRRLRSYDQQSGDDYRRELRARAGGGVSPSGSGVLDSLWQDEVDQLLRTFSTDAAYRELRRRAEGLERFITEVDSRLAARIEFDGETAPSWFASFSIDAARDKRESVLRPLMSSIEFDDRGRPADAEAFDAALAEGAGEYESWRSRVESMAGAMAEAERLLDSWHQYAEAGPAGRSAQRVLDRWISTSDWSDASLRAAGGGVFERLDRFATLGAGGGEARSVADGAFEQDDAMLWSAWLSLGSGGGWPATLSELRRDGEYAERLQLGLDLISDESRRDTLRGVFAARRADGWVRCFGLLNDGSDIRGAAALADEFGVDATTLEDGARFNLAVGRLASLTRELNEDTVSAGVRDTVAELRSLESSSDSAVSAAAGGAIGLLTELVPEDGSRVAFDTSIFQQLGPASVSGLGLSASSVAPDGSWVEYSGALDRASGPVTLRFERIDDVDGVVPSFYMCVDEIPLRIFGSAARRIYAQEARRTGSASSLESGWTDLTDETWLGPRLWTYARSSARFSLNSDASTGGQMRAPQLADVPSLVEGFVAGQDNSGLSTTPDTDMPMQSLSPAACETWARAMGCRLPTLAEWRIAYAAAPSAEANLRDQAWARQRDFVAAQRATAPLPWPNEGGYASSNENPQTAPAASTDDGFVFFRPVDPGAPGLRNLEGNVAEVVYSQGVDSAALAIVGGSAMSPPGLDPTEPVAVSGGARRRGSADIGVRLVLPLAGAGGALRPLSSQLGDALDGVSFLTLP